MSSTSHPHQPPLPQHEKSSGSEGGGVSHAATAAEREEAVTRGEGDNSTTSNSRYDSPGKASQSTFTLPLRTTEGGPRGRGWHRTKGVSGRAYSSGATPYASTLQGVYTENNAGAPLVDPLLTLRSTAAPPSVRNILGVLPATRPQQEFGVNTSTRREAARGKFDRTLDSVKASGRPAETLLAQAARTSSAAAAVSLGRSLRGVEASRSREYTRAHAAEVAEVRNLPHFK